MAKQKTARYLDIYGDIETVKTGVNGVIDIRFKEQTATLKIKYDGLIKEIKSSYIEIFTETLTAKEEEQVGINEIEALNSFYNK